MPGRLFSQADGGGGVARPGDHVPTGEDAGGAGHQVRADLDRPVGDDQAGELVEGGEIPHLTEGLDQDVSLDGLGLAGADDLAALHRHHDLQGQGAVLDGGDLAQVEQAHALLQPLADLGGMGRHVLPATAYHHRHRQGPQADGGAGDVDGGVAAAVDHHVAVEGHRFLQLHRPQHADGVEDRQAAGLGDGQLLAPLQANRQEAGVVAPRRQGRWQVRHPAVEADLHPHGLDALDLGVELLPRHAVLGDAVADHAPGLGAGLEDGHGVAQPGQVIGGGQAGGTGTDHHHPLPRRLARFDGPAVLEGLIAEEALHGVDAHRLVHLAAVAGAFAGVVADPPHDGREGVVGHDLAPGLLVVALLGVKEPGLDVLSGRTLMVAGRHPVQIDRAEGAPGAGLVGEGGADLEGDGKGLVGWSAHRRAPASSSRP